MAPHGSSSSSTLEMVVVRPHESLSYNCPNTPTLPFRWSGTRWTRCSLTTTASAPPLRRNRFIDVFTWNLNFQAPNPSRRLHASLNHLRSLFPLPSAPYGVILLQEVHSEALQVLLAHPWVRRNFQVTDIEPISTYFTITLVSVPLRVSQVFRAPYETSKMSRDVLLVDIDVQPEKHHCSGVFRIANTHLESGESSQRPRQLTVVARHLKQLNVLAAIVGGDMNATPAEKYLPAVPGIELNDMWDIEKKVAARSGRARRRGVCSEERGHTWGYQSSRTVRPAGRLDKILYTGDIGVRNFEGKVLRRVGLGLVLPGRCRGSSPYGAEHEWISDHFGLATTVKVCG